MRIFSLMQEIQQVDQSEAVQIGLKSACKNCNNTFAGNFCNHCGQERSARISYRFLSSKVSAEIFDLKVVCLLP